MSAVKTQKREGSLDFGQRLKLACQSLQHHLNFHLASLFLKNFSFLPPGKRKTTNPNLANMNHSAK